MKRTFILALVVFISGSLPLQSQTAFRSVFSRVYYYDQSGLVGETSVQQLITTPSNSRAWGAKNMVHFGNRFYLSYHTRPADNDNDVFLRSTSDGINWSNPVQANDDSLDATQLNMGMVAYGSPQQPNICVLWSDLRTGDTNAQLRAAVSTDGGNTFGPSAQISDHNDAVSYQPDIAVDANGVIYVAWTRLSTSNAYFTTWFSKSSDDGATWSAPREIHTGRIFSYPPQIIARGNGEALIGICDDQNSISNLVVYTSTDAGENWSPRVEATNYNVFSQGFRFFTLRADAAGNAHFVHQFTSSGPLIETRYQQSNDWGSSWSAPVAISDSSVTQLQPAANIRNMPSVAVSDNGTIYSAWADTHLDPNDSNYESFLTRSTDGGNTWDTPLQINEMPELEDQVYVSMDVKSGAVIDTVVLVWTEVRDTATTAIDAPATSQPASFSLQQNYPNPFNPNTTIRFFIPEASVVSLEIFNILGQRVASAYHKTKLQPGLHQFAWDATDFSGYAVPSGVYFYRLVIDGNIAATKKMMLMK